jgi:osmoprotectant transport system ATP-binding protein
MRGSSALAAAEVGQWFGQNARSLRFAQDASLGRGLFSSAWEKFRVFADDIFVLRGTFLPTLEAMSAAIEFRNVSFKVERGRRLLDDISFAVDEGTTTAVLGRSGSGKTTLLRTVNRMIEPNAGEVLLDGENVRGRDRIALRRNIGYVIQETGLFPHMTVERNVGLVLEAEEIGRRERELHSQDLLNAVGLEARTFGPRYPFQLSGGQRQRVGLARALAAEPPVLLKDEPFGALDPLTRAEMQDMLRELMARLKKTVLLVTHDLDEALYLGDRIVMLHEGRLVADLRPEEFLRSTQPEIEAYVRSFHRGEESAAPNAVGGKRA